MSEQEDKGFRVKDQRRFDAEGKARDVASEEERRGENFTSRPAPEDDVPLPEMNFATFVLSLHASALVHLGLVPDAPGGSASEPHLPLAQQTIEILTMMEQKTRGNLSADEKKLLDGVLYELRMQFVEASRSRKSS